MLFERPSFFDSNFVKIYESYILGSRKIIVAHKREELDVIFFLCAILEIYCKEGQIVFTVN